MAGSPNLASASNQRLVIFSLLLNFCWDSEDGQCPGGVSVRPEQQHHVLLKGGSTGGIQPERLLIGTFGRACHHQARIPRPACHARSDQAAISVALWAALMPLAIDSEASSSSSILSAAMANSSPGLGEVSIDLVEVLLTSDRQHVSCLLVFTIGEMLLESPDVCTGHRIHGGIGRARYSCMALLPRPRPSCTGH